MRRVALISAIALILLSVSVALVPAQTDPGVIVLDGVVYESSRFTGFTTKPGVYICAQDSVSGRWSADPLPPGTVVLVPNVTERGF